MKHLYFAILFGFIISSLAWGQNPSQQQAQLYVDSTGQVYTRADAPAYIFIAPADAENQLMLLPSSDKAANPMKWDGAGKHYIVHKDLEKKMNIRFRIMADGLAPSTAFHFESGLIFRYNNIYFAQSGALATLQAKDDMSGVKQSYLSIDSSDFSAANAPISFLGDKEFSVQTYSTDNVGNVETPLTFRIITTSKAAVQMENIYFESNSTSLNPKSISELNKLAEILKEFPKIHLEIGAHTDSWGDSGYNLQLSERRAQVAVNYLKSKGIPENRLKARGYGETMLLNECGEGVDCPASKHRENRRVEFVITQVDEN